MSLDPQAKWVLDIAEQAKVPSLEEMSAGDAKQAYEERALKLCFQDIPIGNIEDLSIPGPHGDIPLRIYHPIDTTPNLPVVVYYHGGGWVIGSRNSHDALCRQISNQGRFLVVSVDYRMGPEAKFPAAVDDAITAFNWAAKTIQAHGGDPARIAVAGDSAGGNLSAVVCLAAEKDKSPAPFFQWLIYPATNMSMDTQSHQDFSEGYFLTRSLMEWFQGHYLTGPQDKHDWRASPLLAEAISHVAPALIQTVGFDPLKDEGKAYAEKLESAGVPVSFTNYPGMIHGFINLGGAIEAAQTAIDEGVEALKEAFSQTENNVR